MFDCWHDVLSIKLCYVVHYLYLFYFLKPIFVFMPVGSGPDWYSLLEQNQFAAINSRIHRFNNFSSGPGPE